jgi:FixJ family two-component response regulator
VPAPFVSVIDDDASVRSATINLLRSMGYITGSHDSAEAFLQSGEADMAWVIVTDIHMGGMSGFDLKKHLDACGSAVPVIMITGKTEASIEARATDSGVWCFLKKPFDSEQFITCVESAIRQWGELGRGDRLDP